MMRLSPKRKALKKRHFIREFARCGNVTQAALAIKLAPQVAYVWRKKDKKFAAEWEDALNQAADLMEKEARRRAVDGVEEPVYQGGVKVGAIQKYSDTLLIFLLKGARPEKFRDRSDISFSGEPPLAIGFDFSIHTPSDQPQIVETPPPQLNESNNGEK
jgi:hypothetical protein